MKFIKDLLIIKENATSAKFPPFIKRDTHNTNARIRRITNQQCCRSIIGEYVNLLTATCYDHHKFIIVFV
jgi:hypothetical protein